MTEERGEILLGERRIAFTIARSRRRRRTIAFVMESPTALKITAPLRASLSSIRSVMQKQTGWITRRLAEFHRAGERRPHSVRSYKGGESIITYLGHAYRLIVTQDKDQPQGCKLYPHRLIVNFPAPNEASFRLRRKPESSGEIGKSLLNGIESSPDGEPVWIAAFAGMTRGEDMGAQPDDALAEHISQEDIRLEILLWLKRRAKAKLQKRTDVWAERLGVRYQKMVVANAERRWGSCNAQNVIRLSWRLIMAPLPFLDYVVVHELAHVRHKNHGPRFWAQVAEAVPDWKARRKALRVIGDGLLL